MVLAGFTLELACVDLTPPPEVVEYRKGGVSSGGAAPSATGGAGGLGTGGVVLGTGGATGVGGLTGAGGLTGVGGSTIPPAGGGGTGVDAGTVADVAVGSGGVVGSGGSVPTDLPAKTGGNGGTKKDGAAGAGGADVPEGTGGVAGSGGVVGSGGSVATGGVVGSSGGVTGTGGATVGTGGTAVGTGGKTGTGGTPGTGGSTTTGGSTGYNCASAIVPASGVVTNFTDWNATTARWGSGTLTGTIYAYAGADATMAAKVEGTTPGLHLTGSVPSTKYGGGGLTFLSCATVASFTKVSFNVYGSAANCAIELQLQTFDQRPTDQTPPGSCVKAADGSGCFVFPLKSQVVSLSSAVAAPGTAVSTTLNGMTNWTAAAGGQIVGIQWQFTASGSSACTADATFTNIKFLP